MSEFSKWLSIKLNDLGLDETVFSSYVTGILQGEESSDEKIEALEEVLTESKDETTTAICREIVEKWEMLNKSDNKAKVEQNDDVNQKLSQLLESNVRIDTNVIAQANSQYTEEQFKIRQAILSQYSGNEVDADDDDDSQGGVSSDLADLQKNTNASAIHQAEKEKREKAKIESQKKKDKDKEDREKQKQLVAEKKEAKKKKAQKVERRRM